MPETVERELGAYGARIERLEEDMRAVRSGVEEIQATLNETKGSVRTLIAVAGLGGAVGAGLVKAVAWLKGVHP